jgi:hypothetical protein
VAEPVSTQTILEKDGCSHSMGRERAKQDPLRARMSRSDRNVVNGYLESRKISYKTLGFVGFQVSSSPQSSALLAYPLYSSKRMDAGRKRSARSEAEGEREKRMRVRPGRKCNLGAQKSDPGESAAGSRRFKRNPNHERKKANYSTTS